MSTYRHLNRKLQKIAQLQRAFAKRIDQSLFLGGRQAIDLSIRSLHRYRRISSSCISSILDAGALAGVCGVEGALGALALDCCADARAGLDVGCLALVGELGGREGPALVLC
jgi:hypothetical protein